MVDFNKELEDYLDKLGIKTQETKPMNTFSFDVKSGALVVDAEQFSCKKLIEKNTLFKEGSLIVTKEEIPGFFSYDFKETVTDLYMKGIGMVKIAPNSTLLVLKEGIIKSKFDLTSDWTFGMMAKREIESSFRTLKVLSSNKNNISLQTQNDEDNRPIYFTILVNPDFDIQDLKAFFQFEEKCLQTTKIPLEENDLTSELFDRIQQRREQKFREFAERAEKEKR